MEKIKFGTDGWRAIIAKDFTVENVTRVAMATSLWVKQQPGEQVVVVGYDCRFGGDLFSRTTAAVLCSQGIKVLLSTGFVSTPMISFATYKYKAAIGVIITASHNPPSYNGYKLKAAFGGPATPKTISEVEALIPDHPVSVNDDLHHYRQKGLLEEIDFESPYIQHLRDHFDFPLIESKGLRIAYDAMYGAGQRVIPTLLPNSALLHCDYNPSFMGRAPEPLHKNLSELSHLVASDDTIAAGLATDGDADRIGMYDEKGKFVDAHHLLLLFIHYLYKYKNMTGKVVVAFSVSDKVRLLCEHYGLPYEVTKIGFKYISEKMVVEDVLVGGEESGGIALKGHIPERDGIWDGLTILEMMAATGKTLTQLIAEVYEIVGPFCYDRSDLHITDELKHRIIANCESGVYSGFGQFNIERVETIDGYKYFLGSGRTVMIRPSGTEPVLRVYAEAPDMNEVNLILEATRQVLLN